MTGSPVDTVLITGAFGQVGRRCAELLLNRGRTVIATDLRNDKSVVVAQELASQESPGTLVPVYADLLDAEAMYELVAEHRPGAIVHLAAMMSPPSYRNPRLARKVNVEGTMNLVEAAKVLSEPPLVLKASSAAVYGSRNPYRHPEPITPDTPVNPIDQYGEDKVLAEAVVRDSQTVAWVAESQGKRRHLLRALGPVIRPVMRLMLAVQRRVERRGQYADPWTLIGKKYGPDVMAPTDF